ncbi:MAG: RdgB/HAM1 family non-canonical purine NTP pyrophosphatase [Alphaproteobacteria bacterium]|nr:RdgB/HAM1 family non-canonical purine NTP pyrophosphatase [Alphaproteobacteria bacterium]
MARQFTDSKIVIASHNSGKVTEIAELLEPLGVSVISAGDAGLPEHEETGKSFIENAELKAKAAALSSGLPALADDSGLSVSALGGAPGIYSARWAGEEKDFERAMKRVADALLMSGQYDKTAHFHCALSLCWPDGVCETFEGVLAGNLIWPARGDKGFGYDPMFVPNGYTQSFGEMDPVEKHAMSHRSLAFEKLLNKCFQR